MGIINTRGHCAHQKFYVIQRARVSSNLSSCDMIEWPEEQKRMRLTIRCEVRCHRCYCNPREVVNVTQESLASNRKQQTTREVMIGKSTITKREILSFVLKDSITYISFVFLLIKSMILRRYYLSIILPILPNIHEYSCIYSCIIKSTWKNEWTIIRFTSCESRLQQKKIVARRKT